MKGKLVAVAAAGMVALSMAGGLGANPSQHAKPPSDRANCTADEAIFGGEPGKPVANAAQDSHPHDPSSIGETARSNCGS